MARRKRSNKLRREKKKSTEDRKIALIKESREAIPELTGFPDEIILLIAQHLNPSCIVLLALTCHRFYTIFSAKIAPVSLNGTISNTHMEYVKHDRKKLHHALKNWEGLAGYKYFDNMDIYNMFNRRGNPEKWNLSYHYYYYATQSPYPIYYDITGRKMEPGTEEKKMLGGLFFKYPRSDGLMNCAHNKLSEKEKSDVAILMESWTPALEDLQYQLDKHRRLRWSEYLMKSYAEWMDLVGF